MQRIGVLMNTVADDSDGQARFGAFLQGLQQIGLGRRPERADRASDRRACRQSGRVIANTQGGCGRRYTHRCYHPNHHQPTSRGVADGPPILCRLCSRWLSIRSAPGFVESLARPGRKNSRSCSSKYHSKWKMAGIARSRSHPASRGRRCFVTLNTSRDRPVRRHPGGGAPLGVESVPINMRDAAEIERVVSAFARQRTAA